MSVVQATSLETVNQTYTDHTDSLHGQSNIERDGKADMKQQVDDESDDESIAKLHIHEDNDESVEDFDGDFMTCPDGSAYIITDKPNQTSTSHIHTRPKASVQKFQICDSFSAASQKFSHETEPRNRVLLCMMCRSSYPTYTPFTTHLINTHHISLGHQDKLALGNPAVSVVFQDVTMDKGDNVLTFLQPIQSDDQDIHVKPIATHSFTEDMARNLQLASQLSASRILQQVSQNALVMGSTGAPQIVNPFTQAAASSMSSPTSSTTAMLMQGGCPLVSTPPTAARNSCKTLKCPKCNWHYKYQETLEIHMKEKHSDMNISPECSYCRSNKAHPKLARGETYSCGYKPYRCDVCKYSTTTKGNLSIHMQSDKHLNNVQELQQQQAASGNGPLDLGAFIHAPPSVQVMTSGNMSRTPSDTPKPPQLESKPEICKSIGGSNVLSQDTALSQFLDINPAILQQQGSMLYGQGGGVFHCCVCATYSTDEVDLLLSHVNEDRTCTLPSDVSQMQGNFYCNLCNYGSKLKANFQLHTKTDKHMQRLQLVNHVREGGIHNEWRLRYASVNNPVHLRCSPCAEFFTSWHKLQSHVNTIRHKSFHAHFLKIRALPEGVSVLCKLCSTVLHKPADMYGHLQSQVHLNGILPLLETVDDDNIPGVVLDAIQIVQSTKEEADDSKDEDWKKLCPEDVDMTDAVLCCACCSFTCAKSDILKEHMQTEHGDVSSLFSSPKYTNSSRPLLCPLCQTDSGALLNGLKMHLSQVHNVSESNVQRLLSLLPSSNTTSNSPPASVPADSTTEGHNDDGDFGSLDVSGEEYSCPMCLVPFKTCDQLYSHQGDSGHILQQTTHDGPVYSCWHDACNKSFATVHNVQTHFRENHAKNGNNSVCISDRHAYKFRCGKCSLAFRTEEKLQAHSYYHVMRASTRCAVCSRSFRSISSLRRHVEQEHVTTSGNGHSDKHGDHGDNENEHELDTDAIDEDHPDSALNTPTAAEAAYEDQSRKYRCSKCKMAFTSPSFYLAHQRSTQHRRSERPSYSMEKYKDPNRPFKCDICMESFTQRNILSVHYNSVSHLHKVKKLLEQKAPNTTITPDMVNAINKSQSIKNIPSSPFQQFPQSVDSVEAPKSCTPKPYRCNLCQHSSSQGTTFDIHLRSVGHQSRVGKLSELVTKGEVDPNVPLIEQPDMVSCMTASLPPGITAKQILQQMAKQADTSLNKPEDMQRQQALVSAAQQQSTAALVSMMSLAQFAPFLTQAFQPPPLPAQKMSEIGNSSGPHSCRKCSAAFSTDVGLQMHMIECMGSSGQLPPGMAALASTLNLNSKQEVDDDDNENTNAKFTKLNKNGTAFKRLLENFGFEEVMQFNENLQQRKRKAEKLDDETCSKKTKVDGGGIGQVECCHCHRHFSSIWVLKSHIEHVHGETVPTEIVEKLSHHVKEAMDMKVECETPTSVHIKSVDTSVTKVTKESFNSPTESLTMKAAVSTTPQTATTATVTPATPSKGSRSASSSRTVPQPNFSMSNSNALQAALASMAMAGMAGANSPYNFMPPTFPGAGGNPFGFGMSPFLPFMMPSMTPPTSSGDSLEMLKAAASNANSISGGSNGGMNDASMLAAVAQQQAALAQQQAAGSRRARTRITDDQLKVLREYFDINNSPTEGQIEEMSRKSGLPQKVIKHWFRNTLFKERQRNKDSPYNFSIPPSMGIDLEEYEKTGNTKVFNLNCAESPEVIIPKIEKLETDSDEKSSDEQNMAEDTECSPVEQFQGTPQPDASDDNDKYDDDDDAPLLNIKMESDVPSGLMSNNALLSAQEAMRRMQSLPPQLLVGSLGNDLNNPFSLLAAAQAAAAAASFQNSSVSPAMSSSSAMSGMQGTSMTGSNNDTMSNLLAGAINNGSGGYTPGRRANRTRFTDSQLKTLQDFFDKQAYPKDDDLELLSKKLQLSPRVIVVWFQNARQKARKVYENQPPQENTDRFSKTPGCNFQCKRCSLVFQRYYELIQHQQKDCFRDESKRSSSRGSPRSTSSSMSPESASNYSCHQCTVTFNTHSALEEHLKVHASNPLLFMDETSSKMSLNEMLMEQSNTQNIKTEPSVPNVPGDTTIVCVQGRMRSRGGSVSSSTGQSFNKRCPFCGILFHSKVSMSIHIPERHPEQFEKTSVNIDLLPQAEEVPTITTATVASTSVNGGNGINTSMAGGTRSPMDVLKRLSERAGITSSGGSPLDLSRPMKVHTDHEDISASNSASPNASALSMSDFEDEMRSNFGQDSPSPCPSTSLNNQGSNVIMTTQSFARPQNKRFRTHLSPMQVQVMKHTFSHYKTPSMTECEQLGSIIGLHKRVVQVWFQNARAKERKVKPTSTYEVKTEVVRPVSSRCDVCDVTYSSKITMQDHVFNENHIKKLKAVLRSKGTEETYTVEPALQSSKKCKENGTSGNANEGSGNAQSNELNMMLAAASANPAAYLSMMGAYPGMPLYDSNLYGTPVQMLQIPPSVQQNIIQNMQKTHKSSVRFTQDGKTMADLKNVVSDRDCRLCREKDVEVGWGCRKCGTVFQSDKLLQCHRSQVCQSVDPVFKLIQIHYDCMSCDSVFGTQLEFATHCNSVQHRIKSH